MFATSETGGKRAVCRLFAAVKAGSSTVFLNRPAVAFTFIRVALGGSKVRTEEKPR